MALSKEDLLAIKKVVQEVVKPIEDDVKEMKTTISKMQADLQLLATLNQLEEIKRDKRLRSLYMATDSRAR